VSPPRVGAKGSTASVVLRSRTVVLWLGMTRATAALFVARTEAEEATNWISGAVVPSQVAEALPLRLAEEGVFGEHSCIESGIVVRPLQAVLNVDLQRDLVLWLRSGPSFSNCVRVQGSSPARRRPGWGAVLRRLTQLLRSRSRGMA
jgi:hypothetical protein